MTPFVNMVKKNNKQHENNLGLLKQINEMDDHETNKDLF